MHVAQQYMLLCERTTVLKYFKYSVQRLRALMYKYSVYALTLEYSVLYIVTQGIQYIHICI